MAGPLSIDFITTLDAEPSHPPRLPTFPTAPTADEGPIAVVAEVKVGEENRKQFLDLMRELRLAYLRNGASSVRLYESLADHSIFRMEAVSPTWQEHLVVHRRMTKTEREILDRVLQLHTGEEAAVYHYVLITKDIASPKRLQTEVST
jgi:hypothetical protein